MVMLQRMNSEALMQDVATAFESTHLNGATDVATNDALPSHEVKVSQSQVAES